MRELKLSFEEIQNLTTYQKNCFYSAINKFNDVQNKGMRKQNKSNVINANNPDEFKKLQDLGIFKKSKKTE